MVSVRTYISSETREDLIPDIARELLGAPELQLIESSSAALKNGEGCLDNSDLR